jgi:hypothetical protein
MDLTLISNFIVNVFSHFNNGYILLLFTIKILTYYYLSVSEIWPDKRGGWTYKRGITVISYLACSTPFWHPSPYWNSSFSVSRITWPKILSTTGLKSQTCRSHLVLLSVSFKTLLGSKCPTNKCNARISKICEKYQENLDPTV